MLVHELSLVLILRVPQFDLGLWVLAVVVNGHLWLGLLGSG